MADTDLTSDETDFTIRREKGRLGVRKRVYIFGAICLLVSVLQEVMFIFIICMTTYEEDHDVQVTSVSTCLMTVTLVYVTLTVRLLYLIVKERYKDALTPEWLWWLASCLVLMSNLFLIVWFAMLEDYVPLVMSLVAITVYSTFLLFAVEDLKSLVSQDREAK